MWELAKPSASDKSRLRQCAPLPGIVPPKVWQGSENSSLDAAHYSGRVEHRQCRSVDAWQSLAQGWSKRQARSGCEYPNPGSVRRRHNLSAEAECVNKYCPASDGTHRGASPVQCLIEKAMIVRATQA